MPDYSSDSNVDISKLEEELSFLSKDELVERVIGLKLKVDQADNFDRTKLEYLGYELQVHQMELEMQNQELQDKQLELETARDQLSDLYDFSPVSYIALDERGIIENINLTGAIMLGGVRENLIGRSFVSWVNIADRTRFYMHLNKTLLSDDNVFDDIRIRSVEGTDIFIRIKSVKGHNVARGTDHIQSVLIDNTEQVKTQNEMALQARQLKIITDSLPLLIAYADLHESHLFVNKSYANWFNQQSNDLDKVQVSDVWGEEYCKIEKYLRLAYLGHETDFDLRLLDKSNELRDFNISLIPDYDSSVRVNGVIFLIGDITERLADESIDRQRLLDAAHMSRLSTMGAMASEIAHELNQPLTAISTYTNACKRMIENGRLQSQSVLNILDDIAKQTERAAEVIHHIRAFVSKNELQFEILSINNLVVEVIKLLSVEVRTHNIQLSVELGAELPNVAVDCVLMEQVILNLIRNSLDAMENIDVSKRRLSITTNDREDKHVQVCIADSGTGFDRISQNDIFEPFHTTKKDGMGLGLAISGSIVEAHHGRIWVEETNSTGTVFCFMLPVIVEEKTDE